MEVIFRTILVIISCSSISFPQFYADSMISNYVIEFMEIAEETAHSRDSLGKVQKEFSDDEIKHICELYYLAYNEDPVGFNKYISKEKYKWDAKVKESGKVTEPKPAMKRLILVKKIAEKYGISFAEVIGTPAFLRCRYIQNIFSDYRTDFTIIASNFVFVIEEVLKGNKFFTNDDTISIMMIPDIESPSPDFIEGNSYLIPVGTLIGFHKGTFNVVFNYLDDAYDIWEMGQPPKIFLIENEIIKDCEYFGIKDTSWVDFKKYFSEKYLYLEK